MEPSSPDRSSPANAGASSGSPLKLAIVWLVVLAPAVWGVSQTVQTSLKLFGAGQSATTTPATAQSESNGR